MVVTKLLTFSLLLQRISQTFLSVPEKQELGFGEGKQKTVTVRFSTYGIFF